MSQPQFPLYIPSKGRAATRLTSKSLEVMGTPYHIVVEEQEYDEYAAVIDPAKILVLDPKYQDEYDTFDGAQERKGSGPARNFIWEHSIAAGHDWHWIMDDNIDGFWRYHKNRKIRVGDGLCFKAMEDFVLRYSNIAMAGPQYFMFVARKNKYPAFVLNTRIYSCNLIRNDLPYRWRGRFNEDTDLSLRMLKDKWCTVLFNAFLQWKMPAPADVRLAGGNTDAYEKEGSKYKSQMLANMHPDVATVKVRFGRWHHYVDYRPFRSTKLRRKPDYDISEAPSYRMRIAERKRYEGGKHAESPE
jgi:hypothetical protein